MFVLDYVTMRRTQKVNTEEQCKRDKDTKINFENKMIEPVDNSIKDSSLGDQPYEPTELYPILKVYMYSSS